MITKNEDNNNEKSNSETITKIDRNENHTG